MTHTNPNYTYSSYKIRLLNLAKEKGFCISQLKPYDDYTDLETILIYNRSLETSNYACIHISAVHGVEGPAGAEVQLELLNSKSDEWINSKIGIMIIFSLNPFGFHFLRRSSIENIDLNRNVGDGVPSIPEMEGQQWLRPLWLSSSIKDQIQGWTLATALILQKGFPKVSRLFAEGQSLEPQGIFYSGINTAIEIKTLFTKLKQLLKNKLKVSILDAHTGLGGLFDETLFHCAGNPLESQSIFSHPIVIPGEDKNTYRGFGLLADRFKYEFPEIQLNYVVQEFGIKSSARSFFSLMMENQYHWNQFKKVNDNLYLQHQIKKIYFDTYFSQNPKWLQWLRSTGTKRFTEMLEALESNLQKGN